ncbi:DUF393 domain-containing protein [Aquiluna sp.]|jgi:predicted DCC family thiol-disulfide oxidoreductase YuxK|nr:DUF393 domain-containing protein [Aquiluna sp.]
MSANEQLLIFDGDCAICSTSARVLKKMIKDRIAIKPYQRLDLAEYGLSSELTSKAVYYISGKKRYVAAAAMAQVLIDSKTIWAVAGWFIKLPLIRTLAKRVYYVIAANRHRLPGGTPECQLPDNERGKHN